MARLSAPPAWTPPAGCPTVAGPADTGGGGILDDATLTFSSPPCEVAFRRGLLELTGAIRITCPDFANNQAFNLDYTELVRGYVDSTGDRDYPATRNGSRFPFEPAPAADAQVVRRHAGHLVRPPYAPNA